MGCGVKIEWQPFKGDIFTFKKHKYIFVGRTCFNDFAVVDKCTGLVIYLQAKTKKEWKYYGFELISNIDLLYPILSLV